MVHVDNREKVEMNERLQYKCNAKYM